MIGLQLRKNAIHSSIQYTRCKRVVEEDEWVFFLRGRLLLASIKTAWLVLVLLFPLFFTVVVKADIHAVSQPIYFNIPQQRADLALTTFAEQANLTLVFPFEKVKKKTANTLVGEYFLDEAIGILLKNTGLKPSFGDQLVLNIAIDYEEMNMHSKKQMFAALTAFFMGSSASVGALGQEVEAYSGKGLEEIVITASRREKNLNDTPISVAAIGSEEIDRKNISEMNDYLRLIPGVNLVDQGVGRNQVIMRGIAVDPQRSARASSSTVGIYFGEVPLVSLSALGGSPDLKMIDLERVEVLRGPQGTLFGSGALSGAVRNIPNAPVLDELSGSFKTGYSKTNEYGDDNTKFEGVINVPVSDSVAIRAVAYHHRTSGYVRNITGTQLANNGIVAGDENIGGSRPNILAQDAVGEFGGAGLYRDMDNVGETTYDGARLSILWQPTDDLGVNLTHIYQDVEQVGQPYVTLNTRGYTQVSLAFGENVNALSGKEEGQKDKVNITNLVVDYDFGWANLMSSTSLLTDDSEFNYEVSSFVRRSPLVNLIQKESEMFVQEFRLVSQGEGPFHYVAGIYYEDMESDEDRPHYATGEDLSLSFFGNPFGADNPLIDLGYRDRTVEQTAFYGEVSYDFSEQLEFTLGARRFDYERSNRNYGTGAFGERDRTDSFDESGTRFKANLSYNIDDDSLIYFQVAEGFRLGNTNAPINNSLCDVNNDGVLDGTSAPITDGFDSDDVENIELGIKLGLLENRMQVNAAIYSIDWTGIPLTVPAGKLPEQVEQECFANITANAGEAKSQGFELETTYQVTEAFRFSFGGAYTNAELSTDFPAGNGFDGDRLSGSPEYNVNLGINYDFDLSGNPSFIRSDYAYVGDYFNKLGEEGDEMGDYGQLNASAGIQIDQVSLEIYGQNLTNEDALTHIGVLVPDTRAFRLRPRTIGFNVGFHF